MSENENQNFVYDGFNDDSFATAPAWNGEGGGPPEIPVGEHAFELVSLEVKPNKKGNGQNFVCEWECIGSLVADPKDPSQTIEVAEGPQIGKRFKTWMVCAGENFKDGHKRRIAAVFRDALCMLADGVMKPNGAFSTKDAVGRCLYATVTHEPSSQEKWDPQTETNVTKDFINIKLSCERPRVATDEAPAGPPPAAASAPPAQPPKTPPAPGATTRRPPPAPPTRAPGGRAA